MSYTEGNLTILTGIPVAPPTFTNITSLRGVYIIGHDSFIAKTVRLTALFQRQVGGAAEDFFLGMLSVIFIALLSEIVQTIFLRTRHHTVSSRGLYTAYLIDEYSHFRNIWTHATAHSARASRVPRNRLSHAHRRQRSVFLSLFVLLIAALIFAADVVAVYITQPRRVQSSSLEYNLRGVQPVGTSSGLTRYIRSLGARRPCVSPFIKFEDQKRHFVINTCTIYTEKRALDEDEDLSDEITIGSWYHTGGSDHTISFGEAKHTIRIRAEVFLDDGGRAVKRILFNQTENQLQHARYLHDVTIHAAMEWSCNQPFSRVDCDTLAAELVQVRSRPVRKPILFWKVRERKVKRPVTGLETIYRIRMNAPFRALGDGIRILAASSAIYEVEGQGWYENQQKPRQSLGVAKLVSEEGRVAGVYLLGMVVLSLAVLLAVLRYVFQPVSLASVAFEYLEQQQQALEKAGVEDDGKIRLSYDDMGSWSDSDEPTSDESFEKVTGAKGLDTIAELPKAAVWDGSRFVDSDFGASGGVGAMWGLGERDVKDAKWRKSGGSSSRESSSLDASWDLRLGAGGRNSSSGDSWPETRDMEYEDVEYEKGKSRSRFRR